MQTTKKRILVKFAGGDFFQKNSGRPFNIFLERLGHFPKILKELQKSFGKNLLGLNDIKIQKYIKIS